MAISITKTPEVPALSKNVAFFEVSTTNGYPLKCRVFAELENYSEVFDFITEWKATPQAGKCTFYLHSLFEEDLLDYVKPDLQSTVLPAPGVCRRFRCDFYEYDASASELTDEIYSEANGSFGMDRLTAGEDYLIEVATYDAAPTLQLALGANTYNPAKLYNLNDTQWYEVTNAPFAYDTISVQKNTKYAVWKGVKPVITSSAVYMMVKGGTRIGNIYKY